MAVVGLFGVVPFVCSDSRVLTFSNLSKKKGARFVSHDVIGQKPVLEYIGPESDSISMTVRLDAGLGVPPSVGLMIFERMIETGAANLLLIGTEYHGQFVMTSMDVDRRFFTNTGAARVADVKLELKEASSGGIEGLLSLFA